jgi:SAM-dependent methyltransferase
MPHSVEQSSNWVLRWASLIRAGGTVLDLACGSGRHARWLARHGHEVTAVDRDPEAIAGLRGVAGVAGLLADLEGGNPWPLAGRRFDGIVVTNYLHRPLFASIVESLAEDGVLIYETFAKGNERFGRPSNPQFLLQAGELLDAFGKTLTVVAYELGRLERPKPAMIQRLCALRGAGREALLGD